MRARLGLVLSAIVLGVPACTALPIYEYPNAESQADPDEPVGTYNASLDVPWDYDFASASESEAAACRRYLVTGTVPAGAAAHPCASIDRDDNFVALALSGGGSRSAALAAAILFQFKRIGLLRHIDVISAVSGGAQAAALYALMRDAADAEASASIGPRFVLDPDDPSRFVDVFSRDLSLDWVLSLLVPWHMGPYLLTYFDRTDVMADSFSDNYYPRGSWYDINWGMRFRDINPKRPNLLLNAVDMSRRLDASGAPVGIAGECFPMAYETFRDGLHSDLHDFPLARAVMASSAYPGLFHYLSLRDFSRTTAKGGITYVHLADGGIRDHLAIVPINAMLRRFAEGRTLRGLGRIDVARACEFSRGALLREDRPGGAPPRMAAAPARGSRRRTPDKILVIVVDAGRPPAGFPEDDGDPRATLVDRLVPVGKVIDSVDATLDDQRALRALELVGLRNHLTGKRATERRVRDCLAETVAPEDLARCLGDARRAEPDRENGVYGPACCPIIGLGVHDFTKFADQRFGPFNVGDLDSGKVWGADHVTLECLEDNNRGRGRPGSLYAKLRKMPIGLSLQPRELGTIKRAARALVDAMVADFCDVTTRTLAGVAGIPCTPPPAPRDISCN